MMLRCKIFKCVEVGEWRCCVECSMPNCVNRCQNHPDRCRCSQPGESPIPKPGVNVPQYDGNEIVVLAEQGCDTAEICRQMGCSPVTVNRYLRRLGFSRAGKKKGGEGNGK